MCRDVLVNVPILGFAQDTTTAQKTDTPDLVGMGLVECCLPSCDNEMDELFNRKRGEACCGSART